MTPNAVNGIAWLRPERVAGACGAIVIAIGALVLTGWALGADPIKQVAPGLPEMKALTAACLVTLGVALILLRPASLAADRVIGRWLGFAVALIGAMVIIEYLFGSLGIDQALFEDSSAGNPGRPSPQSAAGFIAAGLALFVTDRGQPHYRAEKVLTPLTWLVVIVALVGYAYEVGYLRGTSGANGMAIHTVIALSLVAAGITFLRPDRGLIAYLRSADPGAAAARTMLPVAILVPIGLGIARYEAQRQGLLGLEVGLSITTLGSIAIFITVIGILARRMTLQDVARREAEHSRRQLEHVTERLPIAFYQSEPGARGRWRYVSPQIEQMLGHPAGDWLREPGLWARSIHPDDREEALGNERSTWIEPGGPGASGAFEYRMVRADGSTIWVRDEGVVGEDGYIDGILSDVTGRHEAEERFKRLLEAAPDPMVIVDDKGIIRLINHEVENVLGYTRDELVGKPVELLVPEALRTRHAGHRAGFAHDPTTRPMGSQLELHVRRKDGSEMPVAISLSPMDTEEGKLVIAAIRDVTAQREAEQALRHLAEHDPLTSLHNRRRFKQELERAVAAAGRYETPAAILMLDLDEFKEVNDTLGHPAGDTLLVTVAEALGKRLRETDVLARLGGDEFAVILSHVGVEEACAVAESLLETIRRHAKVEAMPDAIITGSIGVALIEPGTPVSPEVLLSRADIAMYEAKRTGRDRYAVYGEGNGLKQPQRLPVVPRAAGSRPAA